MRWLSTPEHEASPGEADIYPVSLYWRELFAFSEWMGATVQLSTFTQVTGHSFIHSF